MSGTHAFDVEFIFEPRNVVSPEPFYVIVNASGDEFIIDFLKIARAPGQFLGKITHPSEVGDPAVDIFVDPVTWLSSSDSLYVEGARLRVLMYFADDPTAYFDFAKACGPALGDLIHKGRLTADAARALTPYLENWVMSRSVAGRVLPYTYYHVKDYAGLIAANTAKISKVFSVLADDESRSDYARVLYGTNEQYIDAFVKKVFGFQQYNEIVHIRPGMNIINVGVGSGNEVWYFLAKMKGQGRIFNFDPMTSLDQNAFTHAYQVYYNFFSNNHFLLGNTDGEVSAGIGMWGMVYTGPGLNKADDIQFRTSRIDTLFREGAIPRFDYLKMDVEGAELDILKGGIEAIKACRPMIAVTIYHEAEHFWDFPIYLIDELENYRFYVRQYGYSRFETLLYAIPAEDVGSLSGHEVPQLSLTRGAEPKNTGLRSYFKDVTPRTGFNGQTRYVLTRAQGSSWDTAQLTPGPEIHPEEVLGIVEGKDASTIITRHKQGDGHLISVGRFSDPATLTWVAQQGASTRVFAPVFGADDGGPLYAEHDRAAGTLHTVTVDGAAFKLTCHASERRPVLAVSVGSRMSGLLVSGDDGAAIWVSGGTETRLALPGPVETVTSASTVGETGLVYTIGIVIAPIDRKGRAIYPLLANGQLGEAMVLDVAELTVVTTTVA